MKAILSAIFLISLVMGLSGCREIPAEDMPGPRSVAVELAVRPDRMMTVTRSADETAIRDVNLYLYNGSGEIVLHRYQTSSTLRFECVPGNYMLRIVANLGRDLGNNPVWSDVAIVHADEYDSLPMTWEGDMTIPASGGALPAVEVQRAVAKISYDIAVKPTDIELESVQLLSVPRAVSVFDVAAVPSDDAADYTDTPAVPLSGHSAAGSRYLLPNMQGSVPSITDQRQKNRDNAPENASYLLIRALRDDKVLTYTVYLGGNNTSDFNVRANVHYRLHISILGDDEVDTRISSYTLRVWDDFDDYNYGGYCLLDGTRYLHVEVECNDDSAPQRGRLELLSGDLRGFAFNYGDTGAVHDFDLYDMPGDNAYEMEYYLPGYTEENSLLAYRVTLTDVYGFTQTYDFEHRMANAVIIHTDGSGEVAVSGALYSAPKTDASGKRVVTLCMAGCTLTAIPAAGHRFEGWYDDAEHSRKVADESRYAYVPTSPLRHLFAVFRPDTAPLDDKGTANCYIAPQLGTSYSFDATVTGNGRSTTNIWPSGLSGVSARVLWETGTVRGAVIKDAEYRSGRIVFTTGTERGNAVIGLFDASGNCIWSWHIWAVDYDPAASAQTYKSGAVFMDRNLGALTTDCTRPESRGLYYQWGRKDPMIYPSLFRSNQWNEPIRADAVYAAGFEYAESHPRDVASPYDIMTVEWATAHPTTYMDGAFFEDWEEWASVSDWLHARNSNLWGNRTTGKTIVMVTDKSIYDPCPPGWRVPDLEDFRDLRFAAAEMPYCVTVYCNGTQTATYPLGGFLNVSRYERNGENAYLYTASPYTWNGSSLNYFGLESASISVTGTYQEVNSMSYYRYAALPVRCVRE